MKKRAAGLSFCFLSLEENRPEAASGEEGYKGRDTSVAR